MGKTVLAVVGVAATIAIVVAAPYLTPAFLAAAIGTQAAVAVTMGVLSVGLALGFRAIGVGPVRTCWGSGPVPLPPCSEMSPIRPGAVFRLLAWHEGHWGRFSIHRLTGDCMSGIGSGAWALVDHRAIIRRGDLFAFRERTWRTEIFTIGRVKRFLGCNPETGSFDWEMDHPHEHHCDPIADIEWAYRVCFVGSSCFSTLRARLQIVADQATMALTAAHD